jgi:hypothetical protein
MEVIELLVISVHSGCSDTDKACYQNGHVKYAHNGFHVNEKARDRYYRADVAITERGEGYITEIAPSAKLSYQTSCSRPLKAPGTDCAIKRYSSAQIRPSNR